MRGGWIFYKIRPIHKNRAVKLHTIMKNRSERIICFLVVWLTMFSRISVQGQKIYREELKKDFVHLRYPGVQYGQISPAHFIFVKYSMETSYPPSFLGLNFNYNGRVDGLADISYSQPANLYYLQSGFFCKREWEFEKTTHIPFRFRLGSLADCNALEGKH